MRNEITKNDFIGFLSKARICSQNNSRGNNKTIDVVTDPIEKRVWYEFSNNNEVVYTGEDLDRAIELFNDE
jgi:hypothetical protein